MTNYPSSYYAAVAKIPKPRASLEGKVSYDVAVVGGGFTGLAAALSMAERGYSVCLLEQERVGWGASGRNGGQATPGTSKGLLDLISVIGLDEAKKVWKLSREAVTLVRSRIAKGIDCDESEGVLAAALSPRHMEGLKQEADLLVDKLGDESYEMLDKSQFNSYLQSDRYIGGARFTDSLCINPLKYCLGLAKLAEAAGATIYEKTPLVKLVHGDRARLITDQGEVEAKFVILGTNAYGIGVVSELDGMTMPVASIIMATEPLGDELKKIYPKPYAVADCNFVLDYFRPSPEGRLLFGGRAHYNGKEPADIEAALRPRLAKVFPSLANVKVDYCWGGLIDISRNRIPQLGRIAPNVYYAQGYSGQGIALGNLAGTLLAEAVDGTAKRFDVFARIKHRNFPGVGKLRGTLLTLVMLYYKLRDSR